MAEKNPEPAFPGAVDTAAPPGMSVRDYFAIKIMAAALASAVPGQISHDELFKACAALAYQGADAMLEARSK